MTQPSGELLPLTSKEALDAVSAEMMEHGQASVYVALRTALELTGYVLVPRTRALPVVTDEMIRAGVQAMDEAEGTPFLNPTNAYLAEVAIRAAISVMVVGEER